MNQTPSAPLYRVTDENPYLSREEEHGGLTLEAAAALVEDLTGVGADVVMTDWDEWTRHDEADQSWDWTDPETGREVQMRREVTP